MWAVAGSSSPDGLPGCCLPAHAPGYVPVGHCWALPLGCVIAQPAARRPAAELWVRWQALQGSSLFCFLLRELREAEPALQGGQHPLLAACAQYAGQYQLYEMEGEDAGAESGSEQVRAAGSTRGLHVLTADPLSLPAPAHRMSAAVQAHCNTSQHALGACRPHRHPMPGCRAARAGATWRSWAGRRLCRPCCTPC